MIPASVISKMATLGLSEAQADAVSEMLAAVEAATEDRAAAAIEARRRNDRDRKERQRHVMSRDVTGTDVTSRDDAGPYIARAGAPVFPVGISNDIPKLDNPLPTVGPLKPKNPSPKEILSEVVSEKTAADVVAHRKALRKPLTPRAAELLAKSLSASGDAERAAATMIERGWQGYRADWDTPNARAGPARGGNGFAALAVELARNEREQQQQTGRNFEAVPLLPGGVEESGPRAGGDDDNGLRRGSLDLLVGNGFRRM